MVPYKWLPQQANFGYPEAALHASIRDHDHDRLRELLVNASPQDLNFCDDHWGSPLHVAIRYESSETIIYDSSEPIELLLQAGADPLTPRQYPGAGCDPPSPLMLAIGLGKMRIVQRFWEHVPPDAHANGGTQPYWSCIAHAAWCGQADILDYLLNVWNQWSQEALGFALIVASKRLDFFCVEMLIPRTNFPARVLNEALEAAAIDTQYESIERSRELCTVSESLAQERIIRALIKKGANPNAVAKNGEPIVTEAARYTQRVVALKALLEGGADPNAARRNGSTALHLLSAPIST